MKSRKSSIREIVTIWALPVASFFFIPIPSPAQTDPTGSYQIPVQLDDGWEVASLESIGIDTEKIQALTHQWQTEEQFDRIRSMLIVKDGKLVHEAYSRYHQRNTLHVLASITKTFTSTLIGIAIDRGLIDGVDAAVVDLLPDFADVWKDPAKKKIKLKHIMSMTSGLEWYEGYNYNDLRNSEHLMVDEQDWIWYILSRPIHEAPDRRFNYNTGGIHLLSAVLKNVTGLYANEFAEKYLLHPMGVRAYMWNRDPMGYPCTGGTDGGIGLRTRDIAKFGWLFLEDGTWKGQQIISMKWIKEATQNHKPPGSGRNQYGYNWTPGSMLVNGIRFKYIAAFGYGGQNLYLVPEYDLILVFTCDLEDGNADVHIPIQKTFQAIIH